MPSRKSPPRTVYDPQYDRSSRKILRLHGDEDLFHEIELLRYLNLVLLQRMKVDSRLLAYSDLLATLRAVTQSAGRIAYIFKAQYRLFSPLADLQAQKNAGIEQVYSILSELVPLLFGEQEGSDIKSQALMDAFRALPASAWKPSPDSEKPHG